MKKALLIITVFYFSASVAINAQMNQGRILVGVSSSLNLSGYTWGSDFMNLNFSSTKYKSSSGSVSDPDKTTSFTILPKVGYIVIDNVAAGLDFIFSSFSIKYSGGDTESESIFCAGPFVRYYYPLTSFLPYAELNGAIGIETDKYDYGSISGDDKWNLIMFGGGVGAAVPLGERVTFDVLAGYNRLIYKQKGEDDKEITGSVALKMGFLVFFK
jgi:outer membrane protein